MKKSDHKKYIKRKKGNKKKFETKKKNVNMHVDVSSLIQPYLMKNNMIESNANFIEIYNILNSNLTEDMKKNEPFYLKTLMGKLEIIIEEKVKEHSLYELLFWSRRIRPVNVFDVSNETIILYRNLTQLIFAKYCKGDGGMFKFNGMALPNSMKNFNLKRLFNLILHDFKPTTQETLSFRKIGELFKLCYDIEFMSYYYVYLMQRYRICSKGGYIVHHPTMGIDCVIDPEKGFLIDLYDKRASQSNLLVGAGGFASLDFNKNSFNSSDDLTLMFLLFQENLKNEDARDLLRIVIEGSPQKEYELIEMEFISNYLPHPINLEDYYEYARIYSKEFFEYYGFSIEELLFFLSRISQENIVGFIEDTNRFVHMLQRGYMLYKRDIMLESYIESISQIEMIKDISIPVDLEASFNHMFSFLTYKPEDSFQITLQTFGPRKIFYPIDNEIGIVDHTGIVELLSYILDPISKKKDVKGGLFEDIIIKIIESKFGEDSIWIKKRKLKVGKRTREIDVSFVYKDVLIILECKAVNLSWGFFNGDTEAIEFRNMKNMKAIDQADTTLTFIEDNIDNLNIPVPQEIEFVASLLVSPHPEYIWSVDENLFIDSNTPRILAAKELDTVINDNFLNKLKQTPFCRKI